MLTLFKNMLVNHVTHDSITMQQVLAFEPYAGFEVPANTRESVEHIIKAVFYTLN